jgi:hypothetical protein
LDQGVQWPAPVPTEAAGRACRRHWLRGKEKVSAVFGLHVIAYNLIRLGNILLAQPSPQE